VNNYTYSQDLLDCNICKRRRTSPAATDECRICW